MAWWGNRGDGIASLVTAHKLNVKLDQSKLTAHFLDTDAWLYLRGADDEPELRKALGGAYHRVYWDEAQKIPPKLELPIREVFMPALLDFGGVLRLTGSPSRQMNGIFYSVTRPELDKRMPGWKAYHWNLLANPFFGAGHDERWTRGILGLQKLYGGPEVAPIDSPLMQREAFGRWVHEDASYVYYVHRVPRAELFYAPHRARPDGFPDIAAALRDLPWWTEKKKGSSVDDTFFALGADLGYRDPFAMTLWAWHANDPKLYEVFSWRKSGLVADEQNAALRSVMAVVKVGMIVADAAGTALATVKGWSREWVERYNLPILEAEKQHKHTAIETMNNDILRRAVALRDGAPLYAEMSELQYTSVTDGSGKMREDPTQPNDTCDSALYSHRHSYQFRYQVPDAKLSPLQKAQREAREMEDDLIASMGEDRGRWH